MTFYIICGIGLAFIGAFALLAVVLTPVQP
jgi:hypothetical protein